MLLVLHELSATCCQHPKVMTDTPTSQGSSSAGSASGSQPMSAVSASSVLKALSSSQPIPSLSTGVSKEIDALVEAQKKMRAEKAQLAKDLKNAQRRRARLKHKARLLTPADLASVLVLRQEEEEQRDKAAAKRRRSSQPGSRAGETGDKGDGPANGEDLAEEGESRVGEEEEAGNSPHPPAET